MENVSTSNPAAAEFAPSFVDRIKRIAANVGGFFDVSAYKKEIDRYERELEN